VVTPSAYFDTSVLVKRYIREEGSTQARLLVRTRQVIFSAIAPLETISAIRRNQASGSIDDRAFSAIVERFQKDRRRWQLVELLPEILELAEECVLDFNIRALDAIHLASAKATQARFRHRLTFITADSDQRDAASQLHLEVAWVQ